MLTAAFTHPTLDGLSHLSLALSIEGHLEGGMKTGLEEDIYKVFSMLEVWV